MAIQTERKANDSPAMKALSCPIPISKRAFLSSFTSIARFGVLCSLLSIARLSAQSVQGGSTLPIPSGTSVSVAEWSRDGRYLATALKPEASVIVWSIQSSVEASGKVATKVEQRFRWGPMKEAPSALAFSPDGTKLAMCLFTGHLVILDATFKTSSALSSTATGVENVRFIEFSHDGNLLVVGGSKTVFFNTKDNSVAHQIASQVSTGCFSQADGIFLAVPDSFKREGLVSCRFPSLESKILPVQDISSTSSVAISPNGSQAVCDDIFGNLQFSNLGKTAFQKLTVANGQGTPFYSPEWFDDVSVLCVSYNRSPNTVGFGLWHVQLAEKNISRFTTLFSSVPTTGRFPSISCKITVQPGKGDRLLFATAYSAGLADKHLLFHTFLLQDYSEMLKRFKLSPIGK